MIKFSIKKGIFALLLLSASLNAAIVLQNDQILKEEAVNKIESIGAELYDKTGVTLTLAGLETLGGVSLAQKSSEFTKNLKNPYVFLILAKQEHKVEIYASSDAEALFDKEQVLSPYPREGTILPILAGKKGNIYGAALLNGYADIAEQIAKSKGVELKDSIGNTNKIVLNIIRFMVYGSIVLVFCVYLYYRFKGKKNE